ncbi:MAG: ATP-binding cassette domain-containing protein [Bacilli bacterium]|jgi:energy-coupling factor transport system ATP-binding protein
MKDIIVIEDLNFSYGNHQIFKDFNLIIKEGEWLSIVGPNGSGKSTLIRLLVGLNHTDSRIVIDDLLVTKENLMDIRQKVSVIFENPNNQFIGATVRDDIAFTLENLNYNVKEIDEKIIKVADLLNINNILDCEPHKLSGGEKQKVALASILVLQPKVIILDDALAMIDPTEREEILKLLVKLHKDNNLTIINVTNDLEETLYGDRMVVINNGEIVVEGKTLEVLTKDKILTNIGLRMPFMIELSLKLKFYGLIDDVMLDMDEMIDKIWP